MAEDNSSEKGEIKSSDVQKKVSTNWEIYDIKNLWENAEI